MRRFVLAAIALGALGVGGALGAVGSGEQAAEAARAPGLTPMQQRLASGAVRDAVQERRTARVSPQLQALAQIGPTDLTGCPANRGSNVQVNQDCQNVSDPDLAGRGQAQNETTVAQDPSRPARMVAAANDYRRGDSNCHTYYSSDSGRSWKDSSPPTSFTRGDAFGGFPRKYWQAAGDPTVAWDTKGNAYLTCLFFDRGGAVSQNPDASSAFYVFRSTGTGGGSWNFPGRPVAESSDPTGGGEAAFLDKELMTVDNHRGSRFQDRIYVSWTRFDPDGTVLHLPRLLARLRRAFQSAEACEPRQRVVPGGLRPSDAARRLQRQPVLAAVHGVGRHALRDLGQLQHHGPWPARRGPGRTVDRQSRADPARSLDGRWQQLLGAGEGGRLLRPAGLHDLPGRQRRGRRPAFRRRGRPRIRSSGPRTTPWAASIQPTHAR